MKLVTYEYRGEVRAGVVVADRVLDVSRAYAQLRNGSPATRRTAQALLPADTRQIIEGGAASRAAVDEVVAAYDSAGADVSVWVASGRAVPLAEVRLWAPVTDPQKIICLGRNYRAHAEEAGGEVPVAPELFVKFANTLVGHDWPIEIPPITDEVDYEAELAVVIGSRAKDVDAADALQHVYGYTIMHDVSARDYQLQTSQWLAGKSMDTFGPMGPWIVTADEIPDPQALRMRLSIGDEVLQDASTSAMVFSVAEAIAFISSVMTLEPGDVISTGTPEGVGMARSPQRYLRDGEVVDIEIERIGTLSNPVKAV
jgi:acylpyruvate hydrolase